MASTSLAEKIRQMAYRPELRLDPVAQRQAGKTTATSAYSVPVRYLRAARPRRRNLSFFALPCRSGQVVQSFGFVELDALGLLENWSFLSDCGDEDVMASIALLNVALTKLSSHCGREYPEVQHSLFN